MFVFITIVDVHSNICLDGQEPAVSFHFESLSGHPKHDEEGTSHNDYDNEISPKPILGKGKGLDQVFLALPTSGLLSLLSLPDYFIPKTNVLFKKNEASILRPPLRAPPQLA